MIKDKSKKYYIPLDETIAAIGIVTSFSLLLVAIIYKKEGIGLSITFLVSFLFYLFFLTKKNIKLDNTIDELVIKGQNIKLLNFISFYFLTILFFLFINTFLYFIGASYLPLWYFVLISIVSGIIAMEIYLFSEIVAIQILIQIIIFISMIIFTFNFVFPYSAHWYHEYYISLALTHGHIPKEGPYANHPGVFLGYIITKLLLSIDDTRIAGAIYLTIPYLLTSIFFIFIIGKKIFKFNTRVSLLSTLLFSTYVWYLHWGIFTTVFSIGFIVIIIIHFILKNYLKIKYYIILMLLTIFLIMSHILIPFILIVIILTIIMTILIIAEFFDLISSKVHMHLYYLLFLIITYVSYMIYLSIDKLRNLILTLFFETKEGYILAASTSLDLSLYFLNWASTYILYFLAIIGFLSWMRERKIHKIKIFTLSLTVVLTFIAYIGWILGIETLLSHRWLFYAGILIVFPASTGLVLIIDNLKERSYKNIAIFIFIFTITFLAILNTNVSYVLHKEINKPFLTHFENSVFQFIDMYSEDHIVLFQSLYPTHAIKYWLKLPISNKVQMIENPKVSGYFVLRNQEYKDSFFIFTNISKIYDNYGLIIYLRE